MYLISIPFVLWCRMLCWMTNGNHAKRFDIVW